jgi:UDP:flavonoid glycosyltransferase YjiC (YdhE family)
VRALFTLISSHSHWHPLVPLARALQEAGHEVAFATTPSFGRTIEAGGFRAFGVGRGDTPEERAQRAALRAGMTPHEDLDFTMGQVFAGETAERALPDMLRVMGEWRPDVLVHENTEFAGCIAAERAGVPHATYQITAVWPSYLPSVDGSMRRLCESVGLPPGEPAEILYRYLLLWPRPFSLWNPDVPVPATARAFRYEGFSRSGGEELPEWVADLGDRPTVYATLGTFENQETEVLRAILEGLRDEPLNLVLTVGRDRDPAEFGEQPPNVHVERYIPNSLIMPHCDMVLCHSGSGTIMDALSLGRPLVLIPMAADQPENAQRCAALGVACVVGPDERTAGAIQAAVREVLSDKRYREAAGRLRGEIEAQQGLEYPVALLEGLAAGDG